MASCSQAGSCSVVITTVDQSKISKTAQTDRHVSCSVLKVGVPKKSRQPKAAAVII